MSTPGHFAGLDGWALENVRTNRRQLGHGAYGSVEEVEVAGVVCAAKRIYSVLIHASDRDGVKRVRETFERECDIMSKLRHPNIVQFLGVFFPSAEDQRRERSLSVSFSESFMDPPNSPPPPSVPSPSFPWLVMEYLPYTLDQILERRPNLPVHVKVSFLLGIAKGLLYLHNNNIYHRDLTARNVLISSSMVAKIADFGVARMLNPTITNSLTNRPGNILYMPPEARNGMSGTAALYSSTIDIFSFGVIILFTITQMFPQDILPATSPDPDRPGRVIGRTETERRAKYFEVAEQNSKSEEDLRLVKLCQCCLQNDPNCRPKAEVILEELRYLEKVIFEKKTDPTIEMWKKDKLELVTALEERQRAYDELVQRIDTVQSPRRESTKDMQLLLSKVIHLENENRRLREEATREKEELQHKIEQITAELRGSEENLNIVMRNYEDMKREYDNLQSSLSEKQIRVDHSRGEISLLMQTNQTLEQAVAILEEEKRQHNEEMATLMQDKRTLEEEKANALRERNQLRERLEGNCTLPPRNGEVERLRAERDRYLQIIKKKEDADRGETQLLREKVMKLMEENERLMTNSRHHLRLPTCNTFKPPPLPDSGIQVNLPIFWKECTKSTYGLHGAHCVLYGRKLLYGGGEGKDEHRNKILEFDLSVFQWGEFSSLTYEHFSMAVVKGKLLLVGGFNSRLDEYSRRVCQWNSDGKYWSSINRDLPVARCDAAAIGYDKYLIVAGGFNGEPLDSVNILDCENLGAWQSLCRLPSPAYALQSTSYIGKSRDRGRTVALWYLMGTSRGSGISRNRPVYAISLPDLIKGHGTWSVIPDPPFADSGAVTLRGHLLAVGGRDRHTERKEIHMYFPGTSEWLNVASLEYPRHSISCIPLGDKKFVCIGGKDESGDYSTNVDQYNMTLS